MKEKSRIEIVREYVNEFFKDNHYHFELDEEEECLNYSIDLGLFPLCFQLEFWDEEQEKLYPEEFCMLQIWIPLSDWGDDQINIEPGNIENLEVLMDEIESSIPRYKEYLKTIGKIEKHITAIHELFDELELEYDENIDFRSFLK